MVILSTAITSKTGKTLVSRQFVEMTRIRIEGLLAAFPKLMTNDAKQQHTFVETDSVRYVYHPLESMYLLLITNKASNIIEDLETLRLLSKIVPTIAGNASNLSEDKVVEKAFDILFAFDEVITTGGYREAITLAQIKTNMEMESHEEKLHNLIKLSKMESARDQARDAAKSIRQKQQGMQKLGIGGGMQGIGGGSYDNFGGGSSVDIEFSQAPISSLPEPVHAPPKRSAPIKGMSLGGGTKNKSLEDAFVKEDKLAPMAAMDLVKPPVPGHETTVPQSVVNHPIMMVLGEKVSARISRDGDVTSFDIKGSLTLTALNDEAALCSVQLKQDGNSMFRFQTHPNVNKAMFEKSSLIQLKDANKGFPSSRPVGILKWTYSNTSDESLIPLKINCWPEEEARGKVSVSIEYSMDLKDIVLHDIHIVIPLGTTDTPKIQSIDGNHKHNASAGELLWEIDMIDSSNSSGSLEFSIQQKDTDAFFPIAVSFASQQLYCNVDVVSVKSSTTDTAIVYGLQKGLSSDEYLIE